MSDFPPEFGRIKPGDSHVPKDIYDAAHRNFVIAYTDVALRDPQTERFYFPFRQKKLRHGPWFIGGRMAVGETVQDSAAKHVKKDTKLDISPGRFQEISHFTISDVEPGNVNEEGHSGEALNTVLTADLTPEEVATINKSLTDSQSSGEVTDGRWYRPEETAGLSAPVRQFVRDYFQHRVMIDTLHEMATAENNQLWPPLPR